MTFDRDRHAPFEELISASLHGDLTDDERRRLDAHLDGCATCRATLAAFADQRRIMAGLRHVPPPRDLGARVRARIEGGHRTTRRWWQRPPVVFAGIGGGLAVVAGALLALVLLGDRSAPPDVGQASPTVSAPPASLSATPIPTLPPLETPAPTEAATSAAPTPSAEPAPTATPVEASPEPDGYLAVTGPADNQLMTVRDADTGETLAEAPAAVPIAAELSPDGQWVAYIVDVGLSGLTEVRATRIAEGIPSDDPEAPPPADSPVAVGETVVLAESVAGNPFAEQLFWSSHSQYLAFTVVDPDGGGTDVWIFEPAVGAATRATDVGNAYAGSWVPGSSGTSTLWISTAGEIPKSHLWTIHDSAAEISAGDPADSLYPAATNVFQPILSPNGALVIYWTGRMERSGEEYAFVEGGAPWLAENRQSGERGYEFENNRPLFTDVTVDRDAFTSAAIRWAPDSDAFAVWDAAWTGVSQAAVTYPDERRVYLGRATDPRHITWRHALDAGDVPSDSSVVDVKVASTGRHLAITARRPTPGDLALPEAALLLVTRNLGSVADEVQVLRAQAGGWFGPALYSPAGWFGPAATDPRSSSLPLGFPLFPGAEPIGPAAWRSDADPSEITTFYETALREAGFSSIGLGAGTGVSGVIFTDRAGTRWVVSVTEDGAPTEFRVIREP